MAQRAFFILFLAPNPFLDSVIVASLTLGQLQLLCIILKAIKQSFSAILVSSGLPQF